MALDLSTEFKNLLFDHVSMLRCKIVTIAEGSEVCINPCQAVKLVEQYHTILGVFVRLNFTTSKLLDVVVEA